MDIHRLADMLTAASLADILFRLSVLSEDASDDLDDYLFRYWRNKRRLLRDA